MSKVLTRAELGKFKHNADNGYGLTCSLSPENTLRLVAFIEDHLLPVVRGAAEMQTFTEGYAVRDLAFKIRDEGGY